MMDCYCTYCLSITNNLDSDKYRNYGGRFDFSNYIRNWNYSHCYCHFICPPETGVFNRQCQKSLFKKCISLPFNIYHQIHFVTFFAVSFFKYCGHMTEKIIAQRKWLTVMFVWPVILLLMLLMFLSDGNRDGRQHTTLTSDKITVLINSALTGKHDVNAVIIQY